MNLAPRTQARLSRIIDTFYYLLMLVAFYLFMRYAFWLVFPFLFSFFVAAVLQGPMNFAQRKLKIKKSFTSVLLVLLFYVLIILIVVLIGARLWNGAKDFTGFLSERVKNLPHIIEGMTERIYVMTQKLPKEVELRVNNWLANFSASLTSGENAQGESVLTLGSLISRIKLEWFKTPVNGVLSAAGKIPAVAVAVVVTIISSFFMTSSYDRMVRFVKRQLSSDHQRALSAAKRIFFSSMGKLMRSYLIIIGVTFAELTLGLLLLHLIGPFEDAKYLIPIALFTSLADILPAIGVATVLVPWSIYSLIMGNIGMGVGLLVILAVITVVRQILEPKLISQNLGLPAVATLAGIYIGLQLFGFIGIFLIPILLILLKLLNDEGVIKIWKTGKK